MASELLSFRLSGPELEWLKSQQRKSETLNLTAKRLLLGLMTETVYTSVDTSVDTQDLETRIEKKIESRLEEIYQQMSANLNYILDTRLGTASIDFVQNQTTVEEHTVDTIADTQVDSVDTPVDTLEIKTVAELRVIAKSLNITFKIRDNKAKLIELISARKSTPPSHHVP